MARCVMVVLPHMAQGRAPASTIRASNPALQVLDLKHPSALSALSMRTPHANTLSQITLLHPLLGMGQWHPEPQTAGSIGMAQPSRMLSLSLGLMLVVPWQLVNTQLRSSCSPSGPMGIPWGHSLPLGSPLNIGCPNGEKPGCTTVPLQELKTRLSIEEFC